MSIQLLLLYVFAATTLDEGEPAGAEVRAIQHHYRVAIWCRTRGHEDAMREQARKVLALDIDHEGARSLLGFAQVEGRWVRTQETREWVETFQDEVNAELRRLVSADKPVRDGARSALLLTARIEGLADLARHVDRIHRDAERVFARTVVEVRGQRSALVGRRMVGVSLGTGSPVRLQLPELGSVRIGTTGVVPTGP